MSQICQLSKLAASIMSLLPSLFRRLPSHNFSTGLQTCTDSIRTHLVSLIHNSQFRRTEQDQTAAVTGSGAHVAMVDNASGIGKYFMK